MIPRWVTNIPWDHVKQAANDNQVPWKLLGAIVQTESAGETYATRYEPNWRYYYFTDDFARNLGISRPTEEVMQATSWSLGQVMGGTARSLGFEDYLPELCKPELGLKYACLYIKQLTKKYGNNKSDIISAYNAGSIVLEKSGHYRNEAYVDKVSGYLRDLDKIQI